MEYDGKSLHHRSLHKIDDGGVEGKKARRRQRLEVVRFPSEDEVAAGYQEVRIQGGGLKIQ